MINGGMTRKGICLIKAVRNFSRHASEFFGAYTRAWKSTVCDCADVNPEESEIGVELDPCILLSRGIAAVYGWF